MQADIRKAMSALNTVPIAQHPIQAAVLLVISGQAEPNILLTERAAHMRRHAGEVAFPGGKRDEIDATLLDTALRETYEEIGLPQTQVEVLGQLSPLISRYDVQVTPFVGIVSEQISLRRNPQELQSILHVPLSFLAEPTNMQVDDVPYQGRLRKVPRFQYQHYSIWGITALILVEFINTVYGQCLSIGRE